MTSTTSVNTRACSRPFCPVVASSTSSVSSTGPCFSTTRLTLPSSSIRPTLFCSRPAVSISTVSTPASMPGLTASNATRRRVAALRAAHRRPPTRSPQVASCSAAAARKVSAAPSSTVLAVGDQHPGDLAAGGGLAGAVDADHQHDAGPAVVRLGLQRAVQVGLQRGDRAPRRAARAARPPTRCPAPATRSRSRSTILGGRLDADVGGDQALLDLLPGVLVELVAGEHGEQAPAERGSASGQPGRSRTRRPAVGSGVSMTRPGSASAGGSSTAAGGRPRRPAARRPGCGDRRRRLRRPVAGGGAG